MTPKTAKQDLFALKRAYDAAETADGARFLVERLWPRGVKKASLQADGWIKDAAPSTELRKWFHHDPEKWADFRRRYFKELESKRAVWQRLLDAGRRGRVTLIYSSQDSEHNNAVALKEFLERRIRGKPRSQAA